MNPAGSNTKLPAVASDTLTAQSADVSGAIDVPPIVSCETCVYFRALDSKNKPEGVEIDGDGSCYAEPPGMATLQGVHKISGRPMARVTAMRPVVKHGDVCRRWREAGAFEGDAGIALGVAAEAIGDSLAGVVNYLREMASAGK